MKITDLLSENFDDDFEVDYDNPDNTVPSNLDNFEEPTNDVDVTDDVEEQDSFETEMRRRAGDDVYDRFLAASPKIRHLIYFGFKNGASVELTDKNEETFYNAVDLGLIEEDGLLTKVGYKVGYLIKKSRQQ